MGYRLWKGNSAATFGVLWFIFTYVVWIPASIITDRVSFVFYFYPTIGAVCIGLGLAFSQLLNIAKKQKITWQWLMPAAIGAFMVAHLIVLAIISPVFT
jgi:dolichyl-phosphate-mannose--protein O-mannosyl transferase